jgi:hypothetical protein
MTEDHCDVLVIGGGPAGSTIATLLAMRGRDVVLLEKSRHPHFHIGESLLPFNMPLFDQLGVGSEIKAIGMPKYGAEFVSPCDEKPVMFEFVNAMGNPFPSTYQVRRSQFDEILFRNAARKGAHAIEGCRVTGIEFDRNGAAVTAREESGEERVWRRDSWTPPGATRFLRAAWASSSAAARTTARRSTGISPAPVACPAGRRATSPYSGSSTAGSGSFRSPTERRAWAPFAGPTT